MKPIGFWAYVAFFATFIVIQLGMHLSAKSVGAEILVVSGFYCLSLVLLLVTRQGTLDIPHIVTDSYALIFLFVTYFANYRLVFSSVKLFITFSIVFLPLGLMLFLIPRRRRAH